MANTSKTVSIAETSTLTFHDLPVRVTLNAEGTEPLFCLADVCKALGLESVNKTANQIKEEFRTGELNSGHIFDALNREQKATFITEPQLYFVMMRSRAKIAREFRQWICNDVIPAIRRTGAYAQPISGPCIKPSETLKSRPQKRMGYRSRVEAVCDAERVSEEHRAELRDCLDTAVRQGMAIAYGTKEKAETEPVHPAQLPPIDSRQGARQILQEFALKYGACLEDYITLERAIDSLTGANGVNAKLEELNYNVRVMMGRGLVLGYEVAEKTARTKAA